MEIAVEAAALAVHALPAAEAAAQAAQAVASAASTRALCFFVNLYMLGLYPKKEGGAGGRQQE